MIARSLSRSPSTVSRELRRNAATRGGRLDYRAGTAQWKAELVARRPKLAKLVLNDRLRAYVQDRLAGTVVAADSHRGAGSGGAGVGGAQPGAAGRSAVGDGVEPAADLPPAADRLPR